MPFLKLPWQYVLAQLAEARLHAGCTPPVSARPAKVTVAVAPSTWPVASASVGLTWQTPQSRAFAVALPATWSVWAPTRTRSADWPQTVRGGAPVVLSVPPWHMTQFTFQLGTPAGRFASWQLAQETPTEPPARSAP